MMKVEHIATRFWAAARHARWGADERMRRTGRDMLARAFDDAVAAGHNRLAMHIYSTMRSIEDDRERISA